MNQLNSVILEGVVSEGINTEGVFYVDTSRYEKVGDNLVESKTKIKCLVVGQMFVSLCEKITIGRGVRIVGYLSDIGGVVGLFSEHIEFKPDVIRDGKYNFRND